VKFDPESGDGKMSKEDGPDMENRDPNDLNSHVKVKFEDVLGEPEATRSIDCVWSCSYCCFNGTLSCCYKVLTVLCGVPLAFCWGCEFACLACYHVWYYTPFIRCLTIHFTLYRRYLRLCLDTCMGPFCETCGLCFSKIVVKNET
jgi:caveolin 3